MNLHPREERCERAKRDLGSAILDAVERHDLSTWETLRVVNAVASEWVGHLAKYGIREERHGDRNEPGGLE